MPTDEISTSYVAGDCDEPLRDQTIAHAFAETVEAYGERDALVAPSQNVRWSYADLAQEVERAASGLLALGLKKGDRIGIWSPNRVEWVVTQFATAQLGLILVNINPAYRRAELEYALNTVGCAALIYAPTFKTSDYCQMLADVFPELQAGVSAPLQLEAAPALRYLIQLPGAKLLPGAKDWEKVCDLADSTHRQQAIVVRDSLRPNDPINIQFTSGTTGSPKGATLTHFNILNNGWFVGEAMGFSEQDRLCIPVPFYHCFGMVLGNLACVTHGACMVIPDEAFEPLRVLQTVQQERCTALHGVPTMFIAILDHPDFKRYNLSTLRTGIMAGAPCPMSIMQRVVDEMHMQEVTIAYGMTETSPVSFQSGSTDPLDKRVGTVGRIHPHVEVKLIDERGVTVGVGEKGELCTRGYSVMLGYWGDEERTREAIDEEGWMHTGDLAELDELGYCQIVGRVKDMVIRGGENLYPREIEEYLIRHTAVQDVQVFGVPDKKFGEELCAWIVRRPGESCSEQDIRDFCQGQIAHYKIPRYIQFVEEFPMTVTGKAQKFMMRRAMQEQLSESH